MGKYVRYERSAAPYNAAELQIRLNEIVASGMEIVHYEEKKQEPDRFYVTIVCGVINEGKKQILGG